MSDQLKERYILSAFAGLIFAQACPAEVAVDGVVTGYESRLAQLVP